MRSKLWWFTSAFLLWTAVSFVAAVAMVTQALEYLFSAQDDAAVMVAGGSWAFVAGAALAGASTLLWSIGPVRGRFGEACREVAMQACALAIGGAFAATFGWLGPLAALAILPLAVLYLRRPEPPDAPSWRRPGLLGLAAASSGFVIFLVSL